MSLKLSSKGVIKIAERRMFAKTIIDSDAFLDMPLSTQALYFHLSMRADDEGFVNNPKKIQRMIGAADDDAKMLIAKNFVIPFESGVVVIKHWKIHNYIRHDRLNETAYTEERSQLVLKDNGAYSKVCQSSDGQLPDTCQSDDSIGKVRLGKVRLGKDSRSSKFVPPTLEEVREYVKEKGLNIDPDYFYNYYDSDNWMKGNSRNSKKEPMKNWKQTAISWDKREKKRDKPEQEMGWSDFIGDEE